MQDLRHQLRIVLIRICAGETTFKAACSDGACMQAASHREPDGRSAGESSHKRQHAKWQEHGHQPPYLPRPHCCMLACFTLLSSFRRQLLQSCKDRRGLVASWRMPCSDQAAGSGSMHQPPKAHGHRHVSITFRRRSGPTSWSCSCKPLAVWSHTTWSPTAQLCRHAQQDVPALQTAWRGEC